MNSNNSRFEQYKSNILCIVINENYYLSPKDAIEHIELLTPHIYEYYISNTPLEMALNHIMSYSPTEK